MISSYYGFYDYWNNYHKVTFDGVNKLIIINQDETEISVQRDIYSSWKEWVRQEDNSKFEQAVNVVGGEPTTGDEKLDATYFLINGWRLKPYPGSYTLNVVGNLFEVDGGSIKVDADINPLFANNIAINTNTSVIVRRIETQVSGSITSVEGIVTASLAPSELSILQELQLKMDEIWKLHGNDSTASLFVSATERNVANISQSIAYVSSSNETTITRL
jgi:hypothetical protein